VPVKKIENWLISGKNMDRDKVGRFLGHSVDSTLCPKKNCIIALVLCERLRP